MNLNHTQTDSKIDIVYEDSHIVIVNKPSGLLCVPGLKEPDNLFDRVKAKFPNARVVHRLDMWTSGLVIFALNHESQKNLGRQFEHRKISKQYLAIVNGQVKQRFGEIVAPLICDWERRPIQIVDWLSGKSSHTFFERLSLQNNSSVLKLSPVTGRTHQLRLHMLHIGHPILGDNLYKLNDSQDRAERLLLHAWKLKFEHPVTGQDIFLENEPCFDH
jgi:tRNA pseudouridine32 synthase/23S rRNA pseudouridine746 synthase